MAEALTGESAGWAIKPRKQRIDQGVDAVRASGRRQVASTGRFNPKKFEREISASYKKYYFQMVSLRRQCFRKSDFVTFLLPCHEIISLNKSRPNAGPHILVSYTS